MENIAENLLEQCAAISIETGAPVPVYAHQDAKKGTKQDHVELAADDLDGDYEVDIELPTPKFSNLALMQAGAGFVQQGLIPQTVWLEDMAGFEQPEKVQDQQWVEKQMASPEGQAYVLQLAVPVLGRGGAAEASEDDDPGQSVHPAGRHPRPFRPTPVCRHRDRMPQWVRILATLPSLRSRG